MKHDTQKFEPIAVKLTDVLEEKLRVGSKHQTDAWQRRDESAQQLATYEYWHGYNVALRELQELLMLQEEVAQARTKPEGQP
jgi:hypothetical protein